MKRLFILAALPALWAFADQPTLFCEGRLLDGTVPRALQTVTFAPKLTDAEGRSPVVFSPAEYSVQTDSNGYFSFYANLVGVPKNPDAILYLELGNGLPRRKLSPLPLAAVSAHAAAVVPDGAGLLTIGNLSADVLECTGELSVTGEVASAVATGDVGGSLSAATLTLDRPDVRTAEVALMRGDEAGTLDPDRDFSYWTFAADSAVRMEQEGGGMTYFLEFDSSFQIDCDGLCQFVLKIPPTTPLKSGTKLTVECSVQPQTGSDLQPAVRPSYCPTSFDADSLSVAQIRTFPVRAGEHLVVKGRWQTSQYPSASRHCAAYFKVFPFGGKEQ